MNSNESAPRPSKTVEVRLRFEVDAHATYEEIEFIAGTALIQIDEPADEEGEDMPFETWSSDLRIIIDGVEQV